MLRSSSRAPLRSEDATCTSAPRPYHGETGAAGVEVQRGRKAHEGLHVPGQPRKPGYDLVTFEDIIRALTYACKDKYFCVGTEIFCRRKGWPMGGSMSEPATLADL
eukprot:744840-Pyramimonas_sp.AAC.1